jgi:hypothetical protein
MSFCVADGYSVSLSRTSHYQKFRKREKPSGERKKIKIDPRLLIEQWPTTWTEPTMRVMGSIQSGRNLGNVHHSRSQHKGKGKLLHFIYTHNTPPPSALPPLYILIRVQKREEVTTLSIFWVSRKRLKMTFFFGWDYYYYFGERCVCVETFGCFTSSKRCRKAKAAAQNAHDISQKL